MADDAAPTAELIPVSIREVWPNEARDLTPWLAERPEFLGDVLGLELELEGQEMAVGSYSADLVFKDTERGSRVVVENKYGDTDHDHVGKLITYAAGLEASHAVLLADEDPERRQEAKQWLVDTVGRLRVAMYPVLEELWDMAEWD